MIYVVPIHDAHSATVERVCRVVRRVFEAAATPLRVSFDPETAFDQQRHQYSSTSLLAMLLDEVPDSTDKIVAITDGDLFVPILTFVFGEAQLDGNVAIASTYRLRDQFYGLPDDPDLTIDRLEKEVVHELGHAYGLKHCGDYRCVMHPATSVEDIDLKNVDLCASCKRSLLPGDA